MRKKTDQKRDEIVEAASRVFLEAGYERTSMGHIAERMCGSKATIYGYFESKEALFVEAMQLTAKREFPNALDFLKTHTDDLPVALQRFGEVFLTIVCSPEFVAGRRVVNAESGKSEVGRIFYETGPRIGEMLIGEFLDMMMTRGKLRRSDPHVATLQLFALFEAETLNRFMLGIDTSISKAEVKRLVARAVSTFILAYGPQEASAHTLVDAPAKTTAKKRAKAPARSKPDTKPA